MRLGFLSAQAGAVVFAVVWAFFPHRPGWCIRLGQSGAAPGRWAALPVPVGTRGLQELRARAGWPPIAAGTWLRPKLLGAGTWLVAGGSLWIGNRLPTAGLLLGVVGAYCLPDLVLVHAVKRRLQQLRAGFLAALDLLASTAAGGHGLHACLHMVGPRLPGPIRVVVGAALREIDAGRRIHQALAAAGQRSGLTELVTLAGALEEAESLGTPVTTTLRELASGLRVDRRNALEAQASALPLKLSVCTIAFFLPPILVLLVLPNVLGFLGTPW